MTFADFVNVLVGYINGIFIPFVFALAFIAFLWGIFLYLFYEQKLEQARNIILGGVVTLAVMVSLWGILAVLRNTFVGGASYYYDPFGSTWDEFFGGALNRSGGDSTSGSSLDPGDFNIPQMSDGEFTEDSSGMSGGDFTE